MFRFSVVDQDSPHHRRSNGEKMRSTFPGNIFLLGYFEIYLVNKGGCLEGMTLTFFSQMTMRLTMKLSVDEFEQRILRVAAPILTPIAQHFRYSDFRT